MNAAKQRCNDLNRKIQEIKLAERRARIAQDPTHPDWYEGMDGDAAEELASAPGAA